MATPLRDLPTLPGLPLIGHALSFARDPLGLVSSLRDRGPLVPLRIGQRDIVFVTDPALFDEALLRHKDHLIKDTVIQRLRVVLGEGLLTAEGEPWLRNRRLIAPTMGPKALGPLGAVMVDCAQRWADGAAPGVSDLRPQMMALTLDIVTRALFDPSLHGAVSHLGHHIDRMVDAAGQEANGVASLLPQWVPTPGRRATAREKVTLDALFFDLIARRRAAGAGGHDLLGRLLAARDEDGTGLSDAQVRDELVTIFIAGHETTALNLTWALHLLSQHPSIQEAVVAELVAQLGGRDPGVADLAALPLLDAVVSESLRLFPPAWIFGRQVVRPFELGGVEIPVHSELLFSQWMIHRDPKHWPEPLAFRPERWRNGEAAQAHRHAFFPFGVGNRICVGMGFARQEAALALAVILRRLRFAPVPGFVPIPVPTITLRPKTGLPLEIQRRA